MQVSYLTDGHDGDFGDWLDDWINTTITFKRGTDLHRVVLYSDLIYLDKHIILQRV